MRRVIVNLALIGTLFALTGCGGSSFPLALAISSVPATISGGGVYTFSATTTNSTTQSPVIWTLALNTPSSSTDTTTPCTSPCGTWVNAGTTITSQTTSGSTTYYNTVTSITYTAPLLPPTPNSIVLTAAAASNSAVTADVIFTIGAPAIVVRLTNTFTTISPGAPPVTLGATVQFDAANAGVNWSLAAGGSPCSPACGTLAAAPAPSFSATYTPPATVPAAPNNSPTITATSVTTSSSSAFDSFVIQTPPLPISVAITNPFTSIDAGAPGVTVNAQVTNDRQGQGVTWSISPSSNTGALSANEALSVLYTPPNTAPQPPYNTPTITATSVADPTKFASFTFTIDPAGAVKSACDINSAYVFRFAGTDSAGKPIAMVGNMTIENGVVMVNSVDVNDSLEVTSGGGISGACKTVSEGGHAFGRLAFDSSLPSLGAISILQLDYPETRGAYAGDKIRVAFDFYAQESAALPQFGGEFAFRLSDYAATPDTSSIGRFTLSFDGAKGTITNGLMDASALGVGALVTNGFLTGTATPPDANGRGTMLLNFAGQGSRPFVYYAASANEFVLAEMDPSPAPRSASKVAASFSPSLASGEAIGQSLRSLSPAMIQSIGRFVQGKPLSFDPSSGRATLEISDGNRAPLVIYVAFPGRGWFLDTSDGSSNRGLDGPFRFPVAVTASPQP